MVLNRAKYKRVPPSVLRPLDDVAVVAYLAGLIDGEGCVQIISGQGPHNVHPSHSLRVSIASTSTSLMEWLQACVGGGNVLPQRLRIASHKPQYAWTVNGRQAEDVLRAVQPYLVIKSAQADLALRFRELAGPRGKRLDERVVAARQAFSDELHVLNRRGQEVA